MTFGKVQIQKSSNENEILFTNLTIPKKPLPSGQQMYHLKFDERKECLWIQRDVPFFKKRVYHSNSLDNIARGLVSIILAVN